MDHAHDKRKSRNVVEQSEVKRPLRADERAIRAGSVQKTVNSFARTVSVGRPARHPMALSDLVDEHSGAPEAGLHPRFTCRFCGQTHRAVALRTRQRAQCARCGLTLAKGSRFGSETTPALVTTALILAVPALTLPFVTVGKLGSERVGHLFSGARALWSEDMQLLSLWIVLCAGLLPVMMLCLLAMLTLPASFSKPAPWVSVVRRVLVAIAPWAMPEVYLLGVLVALTKLGSLVDVKIGPGFWCYAAMSVLGLLAWRTFYLGHDAKGATRT